jgi:hypothetical protein
LLEGVVVDAEKSVRASNRRKRNLSGDFIQLDERVGSLIVDVTEDGEEDGEETGEGFCRGLSRKYTSKPGFGLACQQLSEQRGAHQPQSPPGALQINFWGESFLIKLTRFAC